MRLDNVFSKDKMMISNLRLKLKFSEQNDLRESSVCKKGSDYLSGNQWICACRSSFLYLRNSLQGVKHSYFFLFFSLNSFFFLFFPIFQPQFLFFLFFSHFKVNVKSGYGYASQLYVRRMASLHLIYHPVEAEYKCQMSLEGSYWGKGRGVPFSILDLCSRKV